MSSGSIVASALKTCPTYVSQCSHSDSEAVIDRFRALTETRPAPFNSGTLRGPNFAFEWPIPPMEACLLPGGIELPEDEVGFNIKYYVDRAISELFDRNMFFFWGLGFHKHGVFRGPYQHEVRWWVKRDLILSPMVFMHYTKNFIIITYDQFHFTLFGGEEKAIRQFERVFGGREALKDKFEAWIDGDGVLIGADARAWAKRYLMSWAFP